MTYRTLDTDLRDSLLLNEPFIYAHLIKFEKPVLRSGNVPARKAADYVYITDASYNIKYNDGTQDSQGTSNGEQVYVANKLLSISTASETIEAKATTINITLGTSAIGTSIEEDISCTSSTITLTSSDPEINWTNLGFSEGHEIAFTSGTNNGVIVRIDTFSSNNKTANVSNITGTLASQGSASTTMELDSKDLRGLLLDKSSSSYSRFINREVYIYKAHIDPNTGAIIGSPFILFKGIVASGKMTDNPAGGEASVSWTISSHWGDFVKVNGRITSDAHHRALYSNGVPDLNALPRKEYAGDLGFIHSDQAINIISVYTDVETRQELKKKRSGFLNWKKSYELVEVEEEVDREVDLNFNLSAKYIPIVYGVNKIDSIPIFADTDKNDPSEVYIAYALCEGQIHSLYDVYIEEQSTICLNKQDWNVRADENTQAESTPDVLCTGRMDKGDVLLGIPTLDNVNTRRSPLLSKYGAAYQQTTYDTIPMWDPNTGGVKQTFEDDSAPDKQNKAIGIADSYGVTFTTPIDTKLIFHSGGAFQSADALLTNKALDNAFKFQQDFNGTTSDYWGQNHRLLDTAYAVCRYTIGAGETEIPELDFVVKGKMVDCYNYDYCYAGNPQDTEPTFPSLGTSLAGQTVVDAFYTITEFGTYEPRIRLSGPADTSSFTSNSITYNAWNKAVITYSDPELLTADITAFDTANGRLDLTVAAGTVAQLANIGTVQINPNDQNLQNMTGNWSTASMISMMGFYSPPGSQYTIEGSEISPAIFGELNNGILNENNQLPSDAQVTVMNGVKIAAAGTGSDGDYIGYICILTHELTDGSVNVQTKTIIDYDSGTGVAIVDSAWDPRFLPIDSSTAPNISSCTVEVRVRGDKRVSLNPAMQLLDYITNNRYGRGLDIDNDIDLNSFLKSARECDTRSDVTVITDSSASKDDKYTYSNGDTYFEGTVLENSTSLGGNLYQTTFTNVIGKLGTKINDYTNFTAGTLVWWRNFSDDIGYAYDAPGGVYEFTGGNPTSLGTPKGSITLSKSGGGSIVVNLDKSTFDGNPIVKEYSSTANSYISGYSLYDADEVKYWRYMGWESQNQREVTRHQTNFIIDTAQPLFSNVNTMLGHFNGTLRYNAGKYNLSVRGKKEADIPITVGNDTYVPSHIREEDIIGGFNIDDEGTKSTYNTMSCAFKDPGNKYESRSVTFLDSTFLREDNNVPKKGDTKNQGITNYYTARLNSKQYLYESRFGLKINFTLPPKGYLLLAGEIITITSARLGFTAKPFRVTNIQLTNSGLVQINAEEHTDTAYLITPISTGGTRQFEGGGGIVPQPGAVTSLAATTNLQAGIQLTWTLPANFNSSIDFVEIYRSETQYFSGSPAPTLIAETTGESFNDNPPVSSEETSKAYYYWARVGRNKPNRSILYSAYTPDITASPELSGVLGINNVSFGLVGGLLYNFSTTVTNENPGSGYIRFDGTSPSVINNIYISTQDINGSAQGAIINDWDDSTATPYRGYLTIQDSNQLLNNTRTHTLGITGNITAPSGYRVIPVDHISGSTGVFVDGRIVSINFTSVGNPGAAGTDAVFYYIKPTQGTAIKNSSGELVVEAHKIEGSIDTLLSSGDIQLYVDNIGKGYSALFSPAIISGDVLVELKGSPLGTVLDTITLVDITDGAPGAAGSPGDSAIYGYIDASPSLAFTKSSTGTWTPSENNAEVICTFVQSGSTIATQTVNVARNATTGILNATGIDDSNIQSTIIGNNTQALTITFTHKTSGVVVVETIVTSLAGSPGADGTSAKVVKLTASDYSIVYNAQGVSPDPSSSITLTATSQNFNTPYYDFSGDVTQTYSQTATASFSVSPTYFSTPKTITVNVKENNQGSSLATDSITIIAVKPGVDGGTARGILAGGDFEAGVWPLSDFESTYSNVTSSIDTAQKYSGTYSLKTVNNYPATGTNTNLLISKSTITADLPVGTKIRATAWVKPDSTDVPTDDFYLSIQQFSSANGSVWRYIPGENTAPNTSIANKNSSTWQKVQATVVVDSSYADWTRIFAYQKRATNTAGSGTWWIDDVSMEIVSDSAIIGILSNESHAFPANSSGAIDAGDYTGSGTTIEVYEGSTLLTLANTSSTNTHPSATGTWGTFNIEVSASNITAGGLSGTSGTVTVAQHSNMTADTASITYTIRGRRILDGEKFTFTKVQSFSKSKAGIDGDPGKSVNIYYVYATSQPSAGGNGSSPTGASWTDTVPGSGTGYLWAVTGTSTDGGSTWTWGTPIQLHGDVFAELAAYVRSSSTPTDNPLNTATYNFSNNTTTSLTNNSIAWTLAFPASGTDPVWVSKATAYGYSGQTDASITNWSNAIRLVEDGADGADGAGGNYLNKDPYFEYLDTYWRSSYSFNDSGSTADTFMSVNTSDSTALEGTRTIYQSGGYNQYLSSERISISEDKLYYIETALKTTGGLGSPDSTARIVGFIYFWDAAGNGVLTTDNTYGWPIIAGGGYVYYFTDFAASGTNVETFPHFVKIGFTMGLEGEVSIPTGATSCRLVLLMNNTGSPVETFSTHHINYYRISEVSYDIRRNIDKFCGYVGGQSDITINPTATQGEYNITGTVLVKPNNTTINLLNEYAQGSPIDTVQTVKHTISNVLQGSPYSLGIQQYNFGPFYLIWNSSKKTLSQRFGGGTWGSSNHFFVAKYYEGRPQKNEFVIDGTLGHYVYNLGADSAGSPSAWTFTNVTDTFRVYAGATQVPASQIEFSVDTTNTTNTLTTSIDTNGVWSISDSSAGVDVSTVAWFKAKIKGINITISKSVTFYKRSYRAEGRPVVTADNYIFDYKGSNKVPNTSKIICTASGALSYDWEYWTGSAWVAAPVDALGSRTSQEYHLNYDGLLWDEPTVNEKYVYLSCLEGSHRAAVAILKGSDRIGWRALDDSTSFGGYGYLGYNFYPRPDDVIVAVGTRTKPNQPVQWTLLTSEASIGGGYTGDRVVIDKVNGLIKIYDSNVLRVKLGNLS